MLVVADGTPEAINASIDGAVGSGGLALFARSIGDAE
jgi:hypothetical protein